MAVGIRSFSALIDVDIYANTANMTILKNTFPSTPTFAIFDAVDTLIYFPNSVSIATTDTIFSTNWAFNLVDTANSGSTYNQTGIIIPTIEGSVSVRLSCYFVRQYTLGHLPYKTYAPLYFNIKQLYNA
jgi:hypothetical protein